MFFFSRGQISPVVRILFVCPVHNQLQSRGVSPCIVTHLFAVPLPLYRPILYSIGYYVYRRFNNLNMHAVINIRVPVAVKNAFTKHRWLVIELTWLVHAQCLVTTFVLNCLLVRSLIRVPFLPSSVLIIVSHCCSFAYDKYTSMSCITFPTTTEPLASITSCMFRLLKRYITISFSSCGHFHHRYKYLMCHCRCIHIN